MRLQLAMNVSNLDESIDFYEKMFDTKVAKVRPGYANFAIENPPLKLVLFEAPDEGGTLNHLGVEVETADQVEAAEGRLTADGITTTGVDETECCFAAKTETWVEGPDNRWEWYVKTGDTEQFGNVVISGENSDDNCCAPVAVGVGAETGTAGSEASSESSCC